jgi:hypothetical protein
LVVQNPAGTVTCRVKTSQAAGPDGVRGLGCPVASKQLSPWLFVTFNPPGNASLVHVKGLDVLVTVMVPGVLADTCTAPTARAPSSAHSARSAWIDLRRDS